MPVDPLKPPLPLTSRPVCCSLPMKNDGFTRLTRPSGEVKTVVRFVCEKCGREAEIERRG